MSGIKVKHVLGLRAIAAGSGLALALIAGTAASSAISSGAARQAADAARPGSGFSVSLERHGSHGKVAPGAAVPYRIELRLPAGSTDNITIATVTDPVSVTLSAVCRKRRAKTPATSLPSTFASSLPSTPGTAPGPANTGVPAPITQEISNAYLTQPSGAARTRPWRPTCAMTASGSARIRAVVHVPKSMAPGTTMQIAVLGIALPAAGAKSGSGSARPALAIAFASLTTRPAHGDGDDDADDGNGATPSPSATPTVSATPSTPASTPAPAVLAEEYLASMTAALGHAPSATLATALRSMASAFQQLAAAIPAPTATPGTTSPATPTPLPSGTRSPRSPSATATSALLPLIPTSPAGLPLPTLSPSSSSTSRPSIASGYSQPANSSTANLNWPDVAAIAVVVGAILALLMWRRRRQPQVRHDNRG